MRSMKRTEASFTCVLCSLLALTGGARAQVQLTGSHLRPQHRDIVEKWLASRQELRLATEADCLIEDGLKNHRRQEGPNYHPYYAVGYFYDDRYEDFAVALITDRKEKWKFVIAVFNGPSGNNGSPSFLIEEADMSDGGFFYNKATKPGKGLLVFGTFETDNCVILLPRKKGYVLKHCMD